MADNQDLIKELKKMNELLEKIDWKLWTFHTKFFGEGETTEKQSSATPGTKDVEPVAPMTKYPTIETWE
jgi:hypothetical protein